MFKKDVLIDLLDSDKAGSKFLDFGGEIIPYAAKNGLRVQAYGFDDYCKRTVSRLPLSCCRLYCGRAGSLSFLAVWRHLLLAWAALPVLLRVAFAARECANATCVAPNPNRGGHRYHQVLL